MARKSAGAVPTKAAGGRRSKTSRSGAKASHGRPPPASTKAPAAKKAGRATRASLEAVRPKEFRRRSTEQLGLDEPVRSAPPPAPHEAEVGARISSGIAEAGSREPAPAMPAMAAASMPMPFPNIPLPGGPFANRMALQQLGRLNVEAAMFFARRSIAATEGVLQLTRCRTLPDIWRVQMTLILDAFLDFQKLTMRLAKPPNDG